jgi:hypothetical protein
MENNKHRRLLLLGMKGSLRSGILLAAWVTAFLSDVSFANSIRLKSHDKLIILNIFLPLSQRERGERERESMCVFFMPV